MMPSHAGEGASPFLSLLRQVLISSEAASQTHPEVIFDLGIMASQVDICN